MALGDLPRFPYGAVYFRKSNPPQADWSTDYRTAAEDGMNAFRHWFMWSAIEVAPGEYDWSDYDRQLDLAAENGIKTIVAEMITAAPEWAFRQFAHARFETCQGVRLTSGMSGSCVTGGFPGLCLDNEDWRAVAERFLRALAERYKDHPGLGGYDVWNESNYRENVCYCPATQARFRQWLGTKYKEIGAVARAWHRYSLTDWEDIQAPRGQGAYPDVLDWLQFRIDDAYRLLRWRVDTIRAVDPDHPIVAHGIAASLDRMASGGADDWRAAAEVEAYGYTWGSSRHGDEPWKQFHAVDMVRAASRGKLFWHAEAYAGPLWMQSNVLGKPRDEGRIAQAEDVRYWDMVSFMCGARGLFYLRWRPLLDGPLFGAFGAYGMDGSRTPRSEMASRVAKWVNASAQDDLWQAKPVQGEIGIVYAPETQVFAYAQQGHSDYYAQSMRGAYQGFFDANVQADWVHIDHIDEYGVLYLPYPVMLSQKTADQLNAWVSAGGALICEGCPGYFGDRGHVGTSQPNLGLDALFGARESYVEFTPDILGDLRFSVEGRGLWGGIFMQAYEAANGTPVGWYADGRVAAVTNSHGRGRTLLLGTMAGAGYGEHPDDREPAFVHWMLEWAGVEQHVRCSDPRIKARMQTSGESVYVWVANPIRHELPVQLCLAEPWSELEPVRTLWGSEASRLGGRIALEAGARDVSVFELA